MLRSSVSRESMSGSTTGQKGDNLLSNNHPTHPLSQAVLQKAVLHMPAPALTEGLTGLATS